MSNLYPAETANGRVTSWIPLTTAYASVQGCSSSFALEGDGLVAFDPGYGISIDPGVRCQPEAVTTWWNQGNLGEGANTAASLGPVTCPENWSTVASSVKSTISTQVMCCPPGYSLINADVSSTGVAGNCVSNVASGAVLPYAFVNSANTYAFTSTTLGFESTVGAIAVVGWNIQFSASSTSSSQSNQAAATTSPSQTISTPTTSASPTVSGGGSNNNGESSGLSTGAKAGIGVGAALGALLVAGLIAWIVILKRKSKRQQIETKTDGVPSMQQYNTNPNGDSNPYKPRELDAGIHQPGVNKYDNSPNVRELDGTQPYRGNLVELQ